MLSATISVFKTAAELLGMPKQTRVGLLSLRLVADRQGAIKGLPLPLVLRALHRLDLLCVHAYIAGFDPTSIVSYANAV